MTSPFPFATGQQPQVSVPPIVKIPVTCCGYTSLQGTPADWTCPGCGTLHPAVAVAQ